jgi:uncharacterized surface protein with fasciclin (FAS1) repeats
MKYSENITINQIFLRYMKYPIGTTGQNPTTAKTTSSGTAQLKGGIMMIRKFVAAIVIAASTAAFAGAASAQNLVETAVGAGDFKTLVAAVKAAGLVETLSGPGPFTVFAPTDEAFAALPAGTVEDLLKPENKDKLISILTYHVVPGKVMSADIAGKEMMVSSVEGSKIDVNATKGVMVDEANVTTADIEASNGVIHVIDKVIIPKS